MRLGPPTRLRPRRATDRRRSTLASRSRLFGLFGLFVGGVGVLALLLAPTLARAESWSQTLVVIDDSGSMDESDPRRLAVMAAMALTAGLEGGDQAAIVGLNELADGAPVRFVAPRDLLAGLDGAEGTRLLDGERVLRIGTHRGGTPCKDALARARDLLEGAASAGVPQTLLLLTDGACNGGAVDRADAWLGGLRSHAEGRFRFVLLTRAGREKIDAELVRYGERTGWTGEARINFDARSLVRAFAEVLSFSRGLRLDDGGRPGLERTFAGARKVRALAIADDGPERIDLEQVRGAEGSVALPIAGGPTFRDAEHGWSLRAASLGPADEPYAVRAKGAGVEVLVIPSYGALAVEAVIAPCEPRPALPWSRELPVRAGQPHCAFARLVGDAGETIVPGRSFAFDLELCDDAMCSWVSAMQPDADGTFNAQLGAAPEGGRHERTFRASGGALVRPVIASRGFQAMSFGIASLTRAGETAPLVDLDLGDLPAATIETLTLQGRGSFPAGASAEVTCTIDGDAALRECLVCRPSTPTIALQDPLTIQAELGATPFCPAISEHGGQPLPVRMRLQVTPTGAAAESLGPTVLPIHATLRYAAIAEGALSVVGGGETTDATVVPSPVAGAVTLTIDRGDLPEGLELAPAQASVRLQAAAGGTARVDLHAVAGECCKPAVYHAKLLLKAEAGGPTITVPLAITVVDPGFWVCPGRKILRIGLGVLGLLFLVWIVRGFTSPAKLPAGMILAYAESHAALGKLREGDEGWLNIDRFPETKRGFRRPAALHLGGKSAPLPSLRRMSPTARVEARPGGAVLLVTSSGDTEIFSESKGWTPQEPGEVPLQSRLVLRREGTLYLMIRR